LLPLSLSSSVFRLLLAGFCGLFSAPGQGLAVKSILSGKPLLK
jgi:hypothetical protein